MNEVYQQRVRFKDPLEAVQHIGKNIQRLIKDNNMQLRFETIEQGLILIYKASIENGIVLKEQIWHQIDKIMDRDLLHALMVLMFISDRSANFCDWRIFILEHPEFWEELKMNSN